MKLSLTNNSKIYILLIAIVIGLDIPQPNMAQPSFSNNISPEKTCEEALKNISQIKVGMKDAEILDLLGKPTEITGDTWSYNFWACVKPEIGAQVVAGVGIQFKDKVVSEIGWATICTMGMASPPPKKKRKKH